MIHYFLYSISCLLFCLLPFPQRTSTAYLPTSSPSLPSSLLFAYLPLFLPASLFACPFATFTLVFPSLLSLVYCIFRQLHHHQRFSLSFLFFLSESSSSSAAHCRRLPKFRIALFRQLSPFTHSRSPHPHSLYLCLALAAASC